MAENLVSTRVMQTSEGENMRIFLCMLSFLVFANVSRAAVGASESNERYECDNWLADGTVKEYRCKFSNKAYIAVKKATCHMIVDAYGNPVAQPANATIGLSVFCRSNKRADVNTCMADNSKATLRCQEEMLAVDKE